MGKNSTPQYNAPPPPKLKTADELYGAATNYAKTNQPFAYGARESALSDLSKGSDYYAGFQPTSFEQALSSQYFQNVWPDTQESIKHGLSLSGLDSSPLLAEQLGKARGGLETQIGQYLSDQGNQRAQYSLTNRLNIDPNSILNPYLQTDMGQSNSQAQSDYDYAQQQAQIDYQQQIDKYNQQQALYKFIGQISPIGGAIYGGVKGGSSGLATSVGSSMDEIKKMMPMILSMFGGGGGLGSVSGATPVNPASSGYNPSDYFSGFSGRGGSV